MAPWQYKQGSKGSINPNKPSMDLPEATSKFVETQLAVPGTSPGSGGRLVEQ